MTPQKLSILRRHIRHRICIAVRKGPLRRLDVCPLLSVLGDELADLLHVVEDSHVGTVTKVAIVEGRAKVLEPSLDGERMQLSGSGGG